MPAMIEAGAPPVIDLEREPGFRLAALDVRPASGDVLVEGRREALEPRPLQVLVALGRRRGEVVGREELARLCWGGRNVGEAALNRCILRLRKLARDYGGFEIETEPGGGYRLIAGPTRRGPSADRRSASDVLLAVLPFENLSGDEGLGWFSDGVSEEILQTVAQSPGLRVIGRSSSFQFRGRDKFPPHVAEQLGATHVLDGSVRRAGEQVRIAAHLVDAATHAVLWSDRFDGDLSDVFGLQDEIAEAVALALELKLARAARPGSMDPAAYDSYLRAKESTEQWLGGSDRLLLETTLALAPDFAPAWASLALTLAIQSHADVLDEPFESLSARAAEAARKALALDPRAGVAYAALNVLEPVCGAFAKRAALMDKALGASPDDPWVLFHACRAAQMVGRHREAFQYAARAREIEPLWPQGANQYASVLTDMGLWTEANEEFDRARARWPLVGYIAINALMRAAFAQDWPRMDAVIESIRRDGPHGAATEEAIRQAQAIRVFDAAEAPAAVGRTRQWLADTGRLNVGIHMLCREGFAGDAFAVVDEASFAHLFQPGGRIAARLSGQGPPTMQVAFVGLGSLFITPGEAMRADPRFVRLCGKLGLVDYWVRTERWPDCAAQVPYDFRAECIRWWR